MIPLGRHLAQNGYAIEKSDKDFFTMTTGPKDTSRFNKDFIVNWINGLRLGFFKN